MLYTSPCDAIVGAGITWPGEDSGERNKEGCEDGFHSEDEECDLDGRELKISVSKSGLYRL